MLEGLVSGIALAWILSLFGVDAMFIEVFQPYYSTALTSAHFYVLFALVGIIGGAIQS